jgi:hypothetical protein
MTAPGSGAQDLAQAGLDLASAIGVADQIERGRPGLVAQVRRRRFCPSCGARRISQSATRLVDHVIPHVPVGQ